MMVLYKLTSYVFHYSKRFVMVFFTFESFVLVQYVEEKFCCGRQVWNYPDKLVHWFVEPINDRMSEKCSSFFIFTIDSTFIFTCIVPLFDSLNSNHSTSYAKIVHLLLFTLHFLHSMLANYSQFPPMTFRRPSRRYEDVLQVHKNTRWMPFQKIHNL